jgi:D-alanine-D-alanine ligase
MSSPAVLFGGPSPEHDVSILTGLQAARALSQAGTPVAAVYWSKSAEFWEVDPAAEAAAFVDGVPRGAQPLRLVAAGGGFVGARTGRLGRERTLDVAVVVNCCHGGPGEDGSLQGALDAAGVAYTGPSVAGAALGMDKAAFGAAVAAAGLPSLPRVLVLPGAPEPGFAGPFIVKPRFGGSSIGIEVWEKWSDVLAAVGAGGVHWRRGAVAEPYRADSYDLNVGVRVHPRLSLSLLEKPLRSPGASEILGYRDKYLGGEGMVSAPRELPADVPDSVAKGVTEAAAAVAEVALVRGVARIDFLVEGDRWWVNEINTIPGSLARYLWVGEAEVPFPRLLSDMVDEAVRRPSARWDATGADGLALRSASSIASKLG